MRKMKSNAPPRMIKMGEGDLRWTAPISVTPPAIPFPDPHNRKNRKKFSHLLLDPTGQVAYLRTVQDPARTITYLTSLGFGDYSNRSSPLPAHHSLVGQLYQGLELCIWRACVAPESPRPSLGSATRKLQLPRAKVLPCPLRSHYVWLATRRPLEEPH